ncbi:TetR/AcrR family transcriptional regulator [Alteromonas sp. MMG017]|uniref:TetR/AcrR family transcriptional regulator n=1 Tax=Alteromonas sp. MMG017 TaxID=2822692 RepID=UPI001B3A34AE|nr:TetR/AcrR family transcriptional regulator [Alteromonas sp. MMG017]MBQ4827992.1 TetR/AcrR family transcriptional regulator [Alteromonas sp. MMG017]
MKRKAGRPRTFDKQEALKSAMYVFWQKGYDGASMKDLTDAMGINSPSLYAVFENKHQLYLEAIKYYVSSDECTPLLVFETEPDIERAVYAFFNAVIEYSTSDKNGATGCFLGSCVATSVDCVDGSQALLQEVIGDADVRFVRRFELEKARGTLPRDFPSLERAQLMFDIRQGIVFRARAKVDLATIEASISSRVKMVLSEPHVKSKVIDSVN